MALKVVSEHYDDDNRIVDMIHAAGPRIEKELSKVIVGQKAAIEQVLITLFAGGHCLLTGPPGLAKTLLVNSVADLFRLDFRRIQFTPDLMPADITGTEILTETESGARELHFRQGPVFTNVLLADEINRTPPKTQAALLEAMQEKQVTAAGQQRKLPGPFFVLATQNPVEQEGTYPLPEAQLDRFLFDIRVDYLPEDHEVEVVLRSTGDPGETPEPLFNQAEIARCHEVVRQVPVAESIVRYAVRLCAATRPSSESAPASVHDYVTWGAGTRAGQALVLGSKARALLSGRVHVTCEDIIALLMPTLRHRVALNYRAEADGVTCDDICSELLATVPCP